MHIYCINSVFYVLFFGRGKKKKTPKSIYTEQGSANFYCERPESNYVRFYRSEDLYSSHHTLLLQNKQPQTVSLQMEYVPININLWTLKLLPEFHVTFMCHEILFFWFFFNCVKKPKKQKTHSAHRLYKIRPACCRLRNLASNSGECGKPALQIRKLARGITECLAQGQRILDLGALKCLCSKCW